jgi:hypothetical protein
MDCPQCCTITSREQQISPLEGYLNTNYAACSSEFTSINKVVASIDDEVDRLSQQISNVHKLLKQLEEKRAGLTEYKRKHLAMMHPIRSIPAEVWADIFSHAVQHCSIGSVALQKPPWSFSRVCHHWREIVLSTSTLWSRLHIDINDHGLGHTELMNMDVTYRVLSAVLERSRNSPLTFQFHGHFSLYNVEETRHLLQLLLAQSYRWRDAEIMVLPEHLLGLRTAPFPFLKKLTLRVSASDTSGRWLPEPQAIALFEKATALDNVHLQGFPCNGEQSSPDRIYRLPWSQLTNLHLSITFPEHPILVLAALQNTPQLLSLTIRSHSRKDNPWSIGNRVTLPMLRSLEILSAPAAQMPILTHLITPELKNLTVQSFRLTPISALIRASSCSLLSLTLLHPRDLDFEGLSSLLGASTPDLRHLTVPYESKAFGDSLLIEAYQEDMEHFLRWKLTSKTPCPKLERLTIKNMSPVIEFPMGLEALAGARRLSLHFLCPCAGSSARRLQFLANAAKATERLREVGCEVVFYDV